MASPSRRPRHADRRVWFSRPALPVGVGVLVLALAVLGFGGAAARIPFATETTPTTQPNTSSGLPSLPPGLGPVWAKNGGQVSSLKTATTVNQDIQIVFAPENQTTETVGGRTIFTQHAYLFPVSPNGASRPFGDFLPVHVKTLSFGGIPTTLTLNARAHPNAAGLPTWFYLELKYYNESPGHPVATEDPIVTGALDLSISDVAVDGVPVNVGDCHTSTPATFVAHGKYWADIQHRPPPPTGDEIPYFSPFSGGQLLGNLVIPSFSGCQNGTENLDPLFNSVVSGDQNTLRLTATGVGGYSNCVNSANTLPYCGSLTPIPLPTNTVHQH